MPIPRASLLDPARIACGSCAVPTRLPRPKIVVSSGITPCYTRAMRIVLAYISALDFWRSALSDEGSARMACRARILPDRAPHALAVQSHPLAQSGASSFPVPLLAHGSQRKRQGHSRRPPNEPARRIAASDRRDSRQRRTTSYDKPQTAFVHMASLLSFPRTVHLGYELCGTFARMVKAVLARDRKASLRRDKLDSIEQGRTHERRETGVRSALPLHLGHVGFSRESTLAERSRPCHREEAASKPEMNAVIPISSSNCWPLIALVPMRSPLAIRWAVEYDSTLCHTGAERIANDASSGETR